METKSCKDVSDNKFHSNNINKKTILEWIFCKKCNGARLKIHKCPFN